MRFGPYLNEENPLVFELVKV